MLLGSSAWFWWLTEPVWPSEFTLAVCSRTFFQLFSLSFRCLLDQTKRLKAHIHTSVLFIWNIFLVAAIFGHLIMYSTFCGCLITDCYSALCVHPPLDQLLINQSCQVCLLLFCLPQCLCLCLFLFFVLVNLVVFIFYLDYIFPLFQV